MNIQGGIGVKITKEQVEYVAHLARLNLDEEEKMSLTKDMEAIITFANQLNTLDIESVSPTAHVIPIQNVFRKDDVKPSMDRDELLQNAPSEVNGCFSVPRIVN